MAYIICQPCIGTKDRSCVDACPVGCIHEGKDQLFIDPRACVDCGACVAACPVSAIYAQRNVPSEWRSFIEKNEGMARDARAGELRWVADEQMSTEPKV